MFYLIDFIANHWLVRLMANNRPTIDNVFTTKKNYFILVSWIAFQLDFPYDLRLDADKSLNTKTIFKFNRIFIQENVRTNWSVIIEQVCASMKSERKQNIWLTE